MPAQRRPDTLTVIAISMIAAALANVLHEGAGHGGACVLSGYHAKTLCTAFFDCTADSRFISAGGTLVNLIVGGIFLILTRATKPSRLRLFFWLLMTFNLLEGAGYFLFSGVSNVGDWAEVIRGLHPAWAWHLLLIVGGTALYVFFAWISLRELQPLLSPDRQMRLIRARRLLFIPYFTHAILVSGAGLLNPLGAPLFFSGIAASFGGCSGMLWMGMWLRGRTFPPPEKEGPPIGRSWAWIITAVVIAGLYIGILGPGVRF